MEVAEAYVDGTVSEELRISAQYAAGRVTSESSPDAAEAASCLFKGTATYSAKKCNTCVARALALAAFNLIPDFDDLADPEVANRYLAELSANANLLRHIVGNPFRPYPAPTSWPSSAMQLAESLYGGQDCAFALHDALLEAGHTGLAEHFRQEQWHPKGCWVVDMILGKK